MEGFVFSTKPNFNFRAGCGRRLRSTKPVKTGYQEGIRENDDCLYSEVRDLQESCLAALDQDSRDFLSAVEDTVEGQSECVEVHKAEQTAEERLADGAPSTKIAAEPGVEIDPEVRIPISIPILPGITYTPAPGSKFAKRFLSKREMTQRLSHRERLCYKLGMLIHPMLGNMSVDAAAKKMGLPRTLAREWALQWRNIMGEAEFEKADISKAREAKEQKEMELLQKIATMPGPRCEPPKREPKSAVPPPRQKPLPPHYKLYTGGAFCRQSPQRVPRAAAYPPDGMDNF